MKETARVTYAPDRMWVYPRVTVFARGKQEADLIAGADRFDQRAYRELAADAADALSRAEREKQLMSTRPLGEQKRPVVTSAYAKPGGAREILLGGFESREMHKAYEAWIESGEAHAAFGTWADEQGIS